MTASDDLDALAAFVAHALAAHAEVWHRDGVRPPPGALTLAHFCARACTGGQQLSLAELLAHGGRMEPLLLTIAETAKLLNVSVRTVRNMLADGRLEAVKVGSCTRLRRADVDALVVGRPTSARFRDQVETKTEECA